jgi:hypothetical protein
MYIGNRFPCSSLLIFSSPSFDLQARSRDRVRFVLHKSLQEASTTALQPLHKRLSHKIRTRRARMRMILGKQLIRRRLANALEVVRCVRSMVNIHGIASQRLRHIARVPNEPPSVCVLESSTLPRVVGCLAAHDNFAALRNNLLAGLSEVPWERVHGFLDAVVRRLAGF